MQNTGKLVAKELGMISEYQLRAYLQEHVGDADLTTPLNKMPDIGVFTNDIRNDLLNGEADIAVHSWKDLPVDLEKGTKISATIKELIQEICFHKKRKFR